MEHIDPTTGQSAEHPASEQTNITRRDFFGLSWRVFTAFAAGQAGCIGLRFLASRQAEGTVGEIVIAGLLGDFPVGTITPFEQARFFLVRFEDGGFLALHTKCTHLACIVNWDAEHNRFSCPCHGSEFELDGTVINPPAPRPLDRFQVIIDADRVKVDTRHAIIRTTTDPSDLVYAPDAPASTPTATPPPPSPTPPPSRPPDQ